MRRLVHFSCGAASAVAAKLTIAKHGHDDTVLVNAFIVEEHADNRRFLGDCERWLGHSITVVKSEKYGGSTDSVWLRKRFMVGHKAAPCSAELKHAPLENFRQDGDIDVLGYTAEESDRVEALREKKPLWVIEAPLVDMSLTKADCLGIIERAGLVLPEMYRLGFSNANCIGCPKGGEGYWNKIRKVFPERFQQVVQIQESIGSGAYFFRNRATGERFGLKDLKLGAGRHNEPEIECSFFCQMAEEDIANAC